MNNDVTELRTVLFDTLRDLRSGAIDTERAKSINETAQTIINSAKVEIEHLKTVGGTGTGFIPEAGQAQLPNGITGITRHRLAG